MMDCVDLRKDALYREMHKLHQKNEMAKQITSDYYEPGNMEFLAQYDAYVDNDNNCIVLKFDVKGTRYEGRTEEIEKIVIDKPVFIKRDGNNEYNANNFLVMSDAKHNLGVLPADLCNAIAPLYDKGELNIKNARVSYVEPISKRSRYAKQAILFIELTIELKV